MTLKKLLSLALSSLLVIASAAVPVSAGAEEIEYEIPVAEVETESAKALPEASGAENLDAIKEYFSGSNINAQEYVNILRWTQPMNSYLARCSDGSILRFQNNNSYSGYLAEYYTSSFTRVSSRLIDKELPIFGGFYSSSNNYFIVSGQKNYEENDSTEVIRITKYDKNWNRISSASLYGANTVDPFQAGSLRFDECGDYLLIRTSHKMYADSNGVNHQANVTIEYNMNTSKITDSFTDVLNTAWGYASHSFNQFIKVEDNKIVAIDHGDAYPRSIGLFKYQTDVSTGKFYPTRGNCTLINVVSMEGSIGANDTGVTAGGFELSDSSYLVAGAIVADSSQYSNWRAGRNVYVAAVSKSTNAVTMNTITNYTTSDSGVVTPQFIKINNNRFVLLWSLKNDTSTVYYTEINGSGQKVGNTYQMSGSLSDCAPILFNNKIVWYTWKDNTLAFNQIDAYNISNATTTNFDYGDEYIPLELTTKCYYSGSYGNNVGTTFRINATATGGVGDYRYAFYYKQSSNSVWSVMGTEYGTSSTASFRPASPVEYEFKVIVMDSKQQTCTKEFLTRFYGEELTNNSTVSDSYICQNDRLTINGAASGGTSGYKYAYYYKQSQKASWIAIGDVYGTATTAYIKLGNLTKYNVMVKVKDSMGTVKEKRFTINVVAGLTNTSYISGSTIAAGDKLTINGMASGGLGGNKYAYYYKQSKNSNWIAIGDVYGTATSASIKLNNITKYDIMVRVKDRNNHMSEKKFTVNVVAPLTNTSTISTTSMKAGSTLKMYGSATGGLGGNKYSYYYKQSSTSGWRAIGELDSGSTSKSITLNNKTTYEIMIRVKDSKGHKVDKTFKVTVK